MLHKSCITNKIFVLANADAAGGELKVTIARRSRTAASEAYIRKGETTDNSKEIVFYYRAFGS